MKKVRENESVRTFVVVYVTKSGEGKKFTDFLCSLCLSTIYRGLGMNWGFRK
jgi:hypothetical protein